MVLMSKREASIKVAEDYICTTQRILELTAEKRCHEEASLLDNFGQPLQNIAWVLSLSAEAYPLATDFGKVTEISGRRTGSATRSFKIELGNHSTKWLARTSGLLNKKPIRTCIQ